MYLVGEWLWLFRMERGCITVEFLLFCFHLVYSHFLLNLLVNSVSFLLHFVLRLFLGIYIWFITIVNDIIFPLHFLTDSCCHTGKYFKCFILCPATLLNYFVNPAEVMSHCPLIHRLWIKDKLLRRGIEGLSGLCRAIDGSCLNRW